MTINSRGLKFYETGRGRPETSGKYNANALKEFERIAHERPNLNGTVDETGQPENDDDWEKEVDGYYG